MNYPITFTFIGDMLYVHKQWHNKAFSMYKATVKDLTKKISTQKLKI